MIAISTKRLKSLAENIKRVRIAVIGDVMLDRYLWGSVNRISPEAPVPVVDIEEESDRLGGAANVANNIDALGAVPVLFGVVGDDASGKIIRQLMEDRNFPTDGIIIDKTRPSTVKTRVIAHNQQVVRTDRESREGISSKKVEEIVKRLENLLPTLDGVILQDYNKGLIVPELIRSVCDLEKINDKPIAVDPKFANFFDYKSVTVFKPNQREVETVMGKRYRTKEDLAEVGKILIDRLNCQNLLITRGEKGMVLFEKEGGIHHIPTQAREVHDVSGAGDTVIGTLTSFMAAGADVREASTLANYAAGVVCGEVGVVPITMENLEEAVNS